MRALDDVERSVRARMPFQHSTLFPSLLSTPFPPAELMVPSRVNEDELRREQIAARSGQEWYEEPQGALRGTTQKFPTGVPLTPPGTEYSSLCTGTGLPLRSLTTTTQPMCFTSFVHGKAPKRSRSWAEGAPLRSTQALTWTAYFSVRSRRFFRCSNASPTVAMSSAGAANH